MTFPPILPSVFSSVTSQGLATPSVISQLTAVQPGMAGIMVAHDSPSKRVGLNPKRYSEALHPFIDLSTGTEIAGKGLYLSITQMSEKNFKSGSLPFVEKALQGIWRQELQYLLRNRSEVEKRKLAGKAEEVIALQMKAFAAGKTIGECQQKVGGILSSFEISPEIKRLIDKRGNRHIRQERQRVKGVTDRLRNIALSIIQLAKRTGQPIQKIDYQAIGAEEKRSSAAAEAELFAELEEETEVKLREKNSAAVSKKKKKKKKVSRKSVVFIEKPSQKNSSPLLVNKEQQAKIQTLLDLHSSKGVPQKVHTHTSRWESATAEIVRTFKDEPGPGQIAYRDMTDEQCLTEIARHRLTGVLHFFKEPFQGRYTYPYTYINPITQIPQKGAGLYAEMMREGSAVPGVITVGMTKKRMVYHIHFKEFGEKIESGADLTESLGAPASFESSEVKWEGDNPYRFDLEEDGVIKMDVPGGLFFRIYPVDYQ